MNPVARKMVVAAALLLTLSSNVPGAVITFTSQTLPLPAVDGNGLIGQLWINVPANADSLALAQAIIAGGFATANFRAITIDYPCGPAGSTSVFASYGAVLDATAITTLDNCSVLTDDVLKKDVGIRRWLLHRRLALAPVLRAV